MKTNFQKSIRSSALRPASLLAALALAGFVTHSAETTYPAAHSGHEGHEAHAAATTTDTAPTSSTASPVANNADVNALVADLKAKMQQLDALLGQQSAGGGTETNAASTPSGHNHNGDGKSSAEAKPKMGMGMMKMKMDGMAKKEAEPASEGSMCEKKMKSMGAKDSASGANAPDKSEMDMKMKMMGMMAMGKRSDGSAESSSPGIASISHLYHVGATGFFLDQSDHITLSADQESAIHKIKEQAVLDQGTFERQVAEAEQQLWKLTAADKPDTANVEAKTREIEKLRADQRLAIIKTVGDAAAILTPDQRNTLTGAAGHTHDHNATASSPTPAPESQHSHH